jgi:hypothetical protein
MDSASALMLKVLRIALGFVFVLTAGTFFVEGGFSRYAQFGMPAHADWRFITLGFVAAFIGAFLVRPFWWRHLSRHS